MSNSNEIPQEDPPLKEGKGVFEIESSRGRVLVQDLHVFQIEVPECEELVVIMGGKAFRIKGLLDAARERDHTGKVISQDSARQEPCQGTGDEVGDCCHPI